MIRSHGRALFQYTVVRGQLFLGERLYINELVLAQNAFGLPWRRRTETAH